ncbi:hypothetical protein [Flavobacterium sp.]
MNPYEKDLKEKINTHFVTFKTILETEKDKLVLLSKIKEFEEDITKSINDKLNSLGYDVNSLLRFSCYQIASNEFKKFYDEVE